MPEPQFGNDNKAIRRNALRPATIKQVRIATSQDLLVSGYHRGQPPNPCQLFARDPLGFTRCSSRDQQTVQTVARIKTGRYRFVFLQCFEVFRGRDRGRQQIKRYGDVGERAGAVSIADPYHY